MHHLTCQTLATLAATFDVVCLLHAVITVVHLGVVIFIVIAGLSQAAASNFTEGGWAPFGVRGVWNGAALVFSSYIGFDAVATTAEKVSSLSPTGHTEILGL